MKKFKIKQKIKVCDITYKIKRNNHGYYLYNNLYTFQALNTDLISFIENIVGYKPLQYIIDSFPYCKTLKDLSKVIKALNKEYRQHNLILTEKQTIKLLLHMNSICKEEPDKVLDFITDLINQKTIDNNNTKLSLKFYSKWKDYIPFIKPLLVTKLFDDTEIYRGDIIYEVTKEGVMSILIDTTYTQPKECMISLNEDYAEILYNKYYINENELKNDLYLCKSKDGINLYIGDMCYIPIHRGFEYDVIDIKLTENLYKIYKDFNIYFTEKAAQEYINKKEWKSGDWYIVKHNEKYILAKATNKYGVLTNQEGLTNTYEEFSKLKQSI